MKDPMHRGMGRQCMKTILLVDDNDLLLALYEEMLRKSGYSVIARPDGGSALAVVRGGVDVDLVITDRQMPGMDGFEFVSFLKHIKPSIPVIMVSADVSADSYLKALNLGAISCAKKPDTLGELHRMVAEALNQP